MSHYDIHVGDVIKYPEMVMARTVNFLNLEGFWLLFPKKIFFFIKQAFYYPPKAGYPIGTSDSPRTLLLELHYDNPDEIEG